MGIDMRDLMTSRMMYGLKPPNKRKEEKLKEIAAKNEKVICPECREEMEEFRKKEFVIRNYETCKDCRYTCSADYVSGFWSGVKTALKTMETNEGCKGKHCI